MAKKCHLKDRLNSFKYAFAGFQNLWNQECNFRIHIFASLLVICLGLAFSVSAVEWLFLIVAMVLVIVLEAINTVIERIANFISPQRDNRIKKIKDISAAFVLLGACASLIIGMIIFLPKISRLIFSN